MEDMVLVVHVLPKDANAIVQYAESLKVDLSLIKKTINS